MRLCLNRKRNDKIMKVKILFILLVAAMLTSCSATKQLTKGQAAETTAQAEAVSARVAMDIQGADLSCTGRLRMLRDDVVQLNLTFMGMNVGTLEFTPDSVLLVDRINRRYVYARYQDVTVLRERSIDFAKLQGLFWGENGVGYDDSQLLWRYTAMGRVNGHKIPSRHEARFRHGQSETGFDMELTEITNDRKWATRTVIDQSKFSLQDANALFKVLMGEM